MRKWLLFLYAVAIVMLIVEAVFDVIRIANGDHVWTYAINLVVIALWISWFFVDWGLPRRALAKSRREED